MPHVDIKCFPRDLTDEQKTARGGGYRRSDRPSSEQQRSLNLRGASGGSGS